KRAVLLLSLFALLLLALPTAAQDAEATPDVSPLFGTIGAPISAPPDCTADDRAKIKDLITTGTASFGQAGTNNAEPNKTPAQYGTVLTDYSGAVADFFGNYYGNFPACLDGVVTRTTVGFIINNTMVLNVLSVSDIAEKTGDSPNADLVTALEAG